MSARPKLAAAWKVRSGMAMMSALLEGWREQGRSGSHLSTGIEMRWLARTAEMRQGLLEVAAGRKRARHQQGSSQRQHGEKKSGVDCMEKKIIYLF